MPSHPRTALVRLLLAASVLAAVLGTDTTRWLQAAEAVSARSGTNMVHYPVSREDTTRLLAARGREQIAAAGKFKAFHDFGFTNQIAASGITFEHHSVDDALRN